MRMHYNFLKFFIVFGWLCLAGCAQSVATFSDQVQPEQPAVERAITRVAGDVYRIQNNAHFTVFMVTDEGVILVDPLNPEAAVWIRDEIETRFNKPITHILYSHAHHDHAAGADVIEDALVISHANSVEFLKHREDQALMGRHIGYDSSGDGVLQPNEMAGSLAAQFTMLDIDQSGVVTGLELFKYQYGKVKAPDVTYSGPMKTITLGGKTVEMHHVPSIHADDVSFVYFPEEKILFFVDVISLKQLPRGALPDYGTADMAQTLAAALKHDAEIIVPSHGAIGTVQDIKDVGAYFTDLKAGVAAGIKAGQTLAQLQASLKLDAYAAWELYETRLPENIEGMYRYLTAQD